MSAPRFAEYPEIPLPGPWAGRGACRSWPTEWWYPSGGERWGRSPKAAKEDAESARRICNTLCPVRNECLIHALTYPELGMWGGLSEKQRARMRSGLRRRSA